MIGTYIHTCIRLAVAFAHLSLADPERDPGVQRNPPFYQDAVYSRFREIDCVCAYNVSSLFRAPLF